MYKTVFGHLLSAQKGASDLRGPLQILFSSHVSVGETRTGEQAAIPTPGTGPLFFKMEKAGCWDCTHKKKHLRGKSPPLFALFFKKFIIIIIQYKGWGGMT